MKPIKSMKLRQSAQGQACTMRVPYVCSHDSSTVVLCHVPTKGAAGMGQKCNDTFAFYGCHKCHQWLDAKQGTPFERAIYCLDAVAETQGKMLQAGLLHCD